MQTQVCVLCVYILIYNYFLIIRSYNYFPIINSIYARNVPQCRL